MPALAPQEIRTFFITSVAFGRQTVFQTEKMALLLIDVLRDNRGKSRFALHEFVVMPDHIHLLFTPAPEHPLEKCAQFVKGGFSFRAKKELGITREIWQPSFTQRRIEDPTDYLHHALYIRNNPVRAGIVQNAAEYPYSSLSSKIVLDPAPKHLQGQSPSCNAANAGLKPRSSTESQSPSPTPHSKPSAPLR